MADIHCARCGEPWDAHGVREHTDMYPSEAERFLRGEGCPHCWADHSLRRPGRLVRFLDDLVETANFDEDPFALAGNLTQLLREVEA